MKDRLLWIVLGVFVLGLLCVALVIPQKEEKKNEKEDLLNITYPDKGNEISLPYEGENPIVAMYVKNYGSIVMELYPTVAPNTVKSFISLIKSGYYDNNTFHRLMPGFVLQGGDPTGTGTGGPGYTIKGEFTQNGFQNDLSHDQWVVSMARNSVSMDSQGGQFFICLEKASSLDGAYATFGKVIDGFDNIKRIVENERVLDEVSGKLQENLVLKKTVVDLKGKEYEEPEIIK